MAKFSIVLDLNKIIESINTFYNDRNCSKDLVNISMLDDLITELQHIINSLEDYSLREKLNLTPSINYFKRELEIITSKRASQIELLKLNLSHRLYNPK